MPETVSTGAVARPTSRRSPRAISVPWMGIILLLAMLGVSKYDPTSYLERGTNIIDAFSWFWRFKFVGFLTFVDLTLAAMFAITMLHVARRRSLGRSPFDGVMLALIALVVAGALLGRANPGPQDTSTDVLFQLRNYGYLVAAYFIASRIGVDERRYQQLAVVMVGLTMLVVLLGYWETSHIDEQYRLSKYGRFATARDATDSIFPIYTQLLLLALFCENVVRRRGPRLLLFMGVLYTVFSVFTSVSKTLIALYPLVLLYLAWHYGYHHRRWFKPVVVAVTLAVICGALLMTNLTALISDPTSALFVYSTIVSSDDFSTATRLNQVLNTLPNLLSRGALLQGLGPGSRWYEYIPQFPVDEAAYPATEVGTGWHLGVHVPLLRILLDFGLLGMLVLAAIVWRLLRTIHRGLRLHAFSAATRACIQPILMVLVFQVTVNNLSVPKTNLIVGILLGATSALYAGARAAELSSAGAVRSEGSDL